jgi:FtsH-binding integral membrane protein
MPTGAFLAGYLLLPIAFGLVPAFLPRRVPVAARWRLWLAILVAGVGYALFMKRENEPFVWLALGGFTASSALSLFFLVLESHRAARRP